MERSGALAYYRMYRHALGGLVAAKATRSTTAAAAAAAEVMDAPAAQFTASSLDSSIGYSSSSSSSSSTSSSHPTPANASGISPLMVRIGSSSVGSIATAFAVTPLDVVKVRQQAMQQNFEAVTRTPWRSAAAAALHPEQRLIHGEMVMSKAGHRIQGAASTAASAASKGLRGGTVGQRRRRRRAARPAHAALDHVRRRGVVGGCRRVPESTLPALLHIYRAEGLGASTRASPRRS